MKIAVSLIVCLLVAGEIAYGCSLRSYEPLTVRPDFAVVVSHHGRPLTGASVRVSQRGDDTTHIEATTDENGMVRIEGLLPGKYDLVASYKDIEAGREWIEVDPTARKAKTRFTF